MRVQKTTFGSRVAQALAERGLQKVDLARHCGMSPSAVTQWISGETKAYDAERVAKAAEFLRIRYEWLLLGEEPMAVSDAHDAAGALFETLPPEVAQSSDDFLEVQLRRSLADDPDKLSSYLRMIDRIRNAKK